MIKFNKASEFFKLTGLGLFCVQLFLFIFCLYPFQSGTWFNTEPAMLALFTLGGLNALWLGGGVLNSWFIIERPVHPLIYGLLAWAGWQFLTLSFAENPLRSLMGVPQTGEGGAWQVLLVILTFSTMPLWENSEKKSRYKKIILSVAAISMCVMTYLHFNLGVFCEHFENYVENNRDTPANWPDYLAFIAVYLWLAFACSGKLRSPKTYIAMMVICIFTIFSTTNTTANFLVFPMLIGMGIVFLFRFWRNKPRWILLIITPSKIWKILAVIGILLPLSWVGISQKQELFQCKNHPMSARAVYNQVIIAEIYHEPKILLIGKGWGEFNDDMFKYGMVDGLYSFKNGVYQPNCMWLAGTVFHPHNQPMQALLAGGLVGFVIFMLLPILAIFPLRRSLFWWCVPVFIALNAVGFTWFTLPQVLPFQALAFAALCAGRPAQIRDVYNVPKWVFAPAFAIAVLFAFCGWQQYQEILYGERLVAIMGEDPNNSEVASFLAEDLARGGDRFIEGAQHYTQVIADKVNSGEATQTDRDWYRVFLEITHQAALEKISGARFVKLDVEFSMMPFRWLKNSPIDYLKPQIKVNLLDNIIRISALAPEREDFIAPFLLSLEDISNGDINKQKEILEKILAVAPKHRAALWLLGGIYIKSPDQKIKQKGLEMMSLAKELGVDRVFPTP